MRRDIIVIELRYRFWQKNFIILCTGLFKMRNFILRFKNQMRSHTWSTLWLKQLDPQPQNIHNIYTKPHNCSTIFTSKTLQHYQWWTGLPVANLHPGVAGRPAIHCLWARRRNIDLRYGNRCTICYARENPWGECWNLLKYCQVTMYGLCVRAWVYLIYYYHKRISNTLKNMIGREGCRGATQNMEFIHDSQWKVCILILTNQKA